MSEQNHTSISHTRSLHRNLAANCLVLRPRMDSKTAFDFLIAGGGTAGCVLASRLSLAGFSVAMFEAGPEDYPEQVMAPLAAPTLHGSPFEYNFLSKEQQHLSNRRIPNFGGRLLSGSSAVNYANWTRCHSADYDAWGKRSSFCI